MNSERKEFPPFYRNEVERSGRLVLVGLGRSVLVAKDGRGEWRPFRYAVGRLVSDGGSLAIAVASATAMVQIASEIRDGKLPRARS